MSTSQMAAIQKPKCAYEGCDSDVVLKLQFCKKHEPPKEASLPPDRPDYEPDLESEFDSDSGSAPDFAGCDKDECGYCGNCHY